MKKKKKEPFTGAILRSGSKLGFWCIISPSGSLISPTPSVITSAVLVVKCLMYSGCARLGEKNDLCPPAQLFLYPSLPLTDSFGKPVDPLPVCICLIPDVGICQVGRGVEPLLEEVALHRDHQVNLQKAHGHHGWSHGDLEEGAITLGPGA